jgi:hypothetical protein
MLVDHWQEVLISVIAYALILIYIHIRCNRIEKRLDLIIDDDWRPSCFGDTNNTPECVYCPWKGECKE